MNMSTRKVLTLKEILSMNTSQFSLGELVEMLPHTDNPKEFADWIFQIRLKHEDDTGIPTEEDDMGEQECEMLERQFSWLIEKLDQAEYQCNPKDVVEIHDPIDPRLLDGLEGSNTKGE